MISGLTVAPAAIAAASSIVERLADGVARGFTLGRTKAAAPPEAGASSPPVIAGDDRQEEMLATGAGQRAEQVVLRKNIARLRGQLAAALTAQFARLGVDTSQPIELEVDAEGRVLEVGGHIDRDKIEQLFETHPQLAQQLRSVLRQSDRYAGADPAVTGHAAARTRAIFSGGELLLQEG